MASDVSRADRFISQAAPFEQRVYFLCLRIMGSRQDAEDCAQESMLRAFRAYDSFRRDSGMGTWLYTIATRCCMDALRRRRELLSLEALAEEGLESASDEPSPYLRLEEKERKRLLGEALGTLPAVHRLPLVLCDLQGMSYEEAARALECPVGTIRSRLYRARQALRRILSSQGELFHDASRPNDERRENR